MAAKPAVDIRYADPNFFVGAISGAIDTLTAKLQAIAELNTDEKWKNVFNANRPNLPETAMLYFNVGAVAATMGSNINATVTTLPQSTPTPWIPITNADRIKISGTIEVIIKW